MDILYLLIPLSVLAMFGVLGIFAWALHRGQFDDLEYEGERVLFDLDQSNQAAAPEQPAGPLGVASAAEAGECALAPLKTLTCNKSRQTAVS